MISIDLDIDDYVSDRLELFGRRAPTIMRRIARTTGQEFRKFMKKNYLRGQVIGKRTGRLYKDVKIVNDKREKTAVVVRPSARLANIYHHIGGIDIRPKSAKVLKFDIDGVPQFARHVHLEERPWVPRARREFPWRVWIVRSADKVLERELEKLELKNGTS